MVSMVTGDFPIVLCMSRRYRQNDLKEGDLLYMFLVPDRNIDCWLGDNLGLLILTLGFTCWQIYRHNQPRQKREMTSSISSLVSIWKIHHYSPGCSFGWILRVVYFPVKHSRLYNKASYLSFLLQFVSLLEVPLSMYCKSNKPIGLNLIYHEGPKKIILVKSPVNCDVISGKNDVTLLWNVRQCGFAILCCLREISWK